MIFPEPVCGMTWGWVGNSHEWATPEAEHSMDQLARINANWVTIAFQALQDHPQATVIDYTDSSLVTDDQVRWAIREAKARGMKVCLKPIVNCRNGTWRGFISFFDLEVPGEPSWSEWFSSYEKYLCHFAEIAEDEGVDLFCVGCEMVMADSREKQWRSVCDEVRSLYRGPITYNCDKYQEDRVTWWDAVDVISSSGYYPEHSWPDHLDRIEAVVARFNKPFVFLEAGCPSRDTSPAKPNDWALPGAVSMSAQERFYREMMTAFDRPWMRGFMLWDWPATLYAEEDAHSNGDYCVFGKPAERVVAEWYSGVKEREKK